MKTVHPLVTLRRSSGLASVRGLSAKQLHSKNPALAIKWAAFVGQHKDAIARSLVASL